MSFMKTDKVGFMFYYAIGHVEVSYTGLQPGQF